MKPDYDFSTSRKNPYAGRLRQQVTLRLDTLTLEYFKQLSAEMGVPHKDLISLFLQHCAAQRLRPSYPRPNPPSSRPGKRATKS